MTDKDVQTTVNEDSVVILVEDGVIYDDSDN